MSDDFEPSLEYAGTSGNVNVDTSRDATIHADMSGITSTAQKYVLIVAGMMKGKGVTVAELRERNGKVHHGRVSAALTNLHIAGRLVALRERRGHCGIYVLPEYAGDRERRAYRPNRRPVDAEIIVGVLLDHRQYTASDYCHGQGCTWEAGRGVTFTQHQAQMIAEVLS